jgi:hypothetical protein
MKSFLDWNENEYGKGSKHKLGAFLVEWERLKIYASFEFYAFLSVVFVADHLGMGAG